MADNNAQFSIGRDSRYVVGGPFGRLELSGMTSVQTQPKYNTAASRRLNSPSVVRQMPDGWDIRISVDRTDAELDHLITQMEQHFWTGGTIPLGWLQEVTQNPDGTISRYQYTGIAWVVNGVGEKRQESIVVQTLAGHAQRREAI